MAMDDAEIVYKKISYDNMINTFKLMDKINLEIGKLLDEDLNYNGDNTYRIHKLIMDKIDLEHMIEEQLGLRCNCNNCKNSSKCNK